MCEIAYQSEMSIDHTRRIISEEMRKITLGKASIALNILRQRIAVVPIRNGNITAVQDIAGDQCFGNKKRIPFLFNVLTALFPRKYRIIDDQYMTNLSPSEFVKRAKG